MLEQVQLETNQVRSATDQHKPALQHAIFSGYYCHCNCMSRISAQYHSTSLLQVSHKEPALGSRGIDGAEPV